MKKTAVMAGIALLVFAPTAAWAEGYWGSMGRNLVRGAKNVVSSPLEIPATVGEYHNGSGRGGVRHLAGLADGTVQMVTRLGSGLLDFPAAFIPGDQEGLPVEPETLF